MNGRLNRVEMQWVILPESTEKFTGGECYPLRICGTLSGHKGGIDVGKEVLAEEIGELFVRGSAIVNPLLQYTMGECANQTLDLSSSLLRWVCSSPERVLSLSKVIRSRSKSQDPLRISDSFGSVPTFLLNLKNQEMEFRHCPHQISEANDICLGEISTVPSHLPQTSKASQQLNLFLGQKKKRPTS